MAFGAGQFGSLAVGNGTAVTGEAVTFSPVVLPRDGGQELRFTGITAGNYRAHFGPSLTTVDPLCYSGILGQDFDIVSAGTSAQISIWMPPSPVGQAGVLFRSMDGGSDINTGLIFAVIAHPFRGKVLELRDILPSNYAKGYSQTKIVELPQT